MNASDFDHLDGSDGLGLGPDLTARLRAAAGAEPDLAAAHAVLGRRVAGARRRRAAAVTGSAALAVLLLGAVYVVNTGDRGGRVSSADAPSVASFGDDDSTTSVTATSLTTVAPVVVTTLPGGSVDTAATADPSSSAATSSSVDGDATETDRELFDVTAAAAEVRTVSGIGGSVDVRVENGVLSFAGFPVAAQGFTAQVTRDEPGRLEVTFTSATHLTRLRVRLDGARWRADRHEEAIPTSSVPGAPTGTAPHTSTDDGDDHDDDHGSNDDSNDDADDSNGGGSNGGGSNDDSNGDSNDDQGSGGSGSNRGSGSGSSGSSGGSGSDG